MPASSPQKVTEMAATFLMRKQQSQVLTETPCHQGDIGLALSSHLVLGEKTGLYEKQYHGQYTPTEQQLK